MKIERSRTETSDTNRPEMLARPAQDSIAARSTAAAPVPAAEQGKFSKLLEVAKEATDDHRSEKASADGDSENSVDRKDGGKGDTVVRASKDKRDESDGFSGDASGDGEPAWAPPQVSVVETSDTTANLPQTRSILHVADLERMISSVRSDSFAGTKQVTIDLKNSVLDGLKVQLTLTEEGKIKAEFIAQNEQIRKQLEARKAELETVLKDRSAKFGEVNIQVTSPENEPGLDKGAARHI